MNIICPVCASNEVKQLYEKDNIKTFNCKHCKQFFKIEPKREGFIPED